MNHKAYFFTIDGIIALIVLVTGVVIIGSVLSSQPIFQPPYNYGEDILRVMSSSNISTFNTPAKPGIAALFTAKKISSNRSTVLQQVGIFYSDYCINKGTLIGDQAIKDANTIVTELIGTIIPRPYYAELSIIGCNVNPDFIYSNFASTREAVELSKSDSKLIMSTQKVVFGNKDPSTLFGPYIARMTLWR